MMYRLMLSLMLISLLASCHQGTQITLTNTLPDERTDELIVIQRSDIQEFAEMQKEGLVVSVLDPDDNYLPAQCDDLDGDGSWDELAFLVDLTAESSLEVTLDWVDPDLSGGYPERTQVYLAKETANGLFEEVQTAQAPYGNDGFPTQYQAEGVGWENDRMAFRVYFDCRNTKDLFGKLKPGLILQNAGKPGFGSYHELADWGMDVLHCGSSLGVGGMALWDQDSLYRLGLTQHYGYREISDGPARAVFELSYAGWEVNGQSLQATERISIQPGKQGFLSTVTVKGFSGPAGLVTGLVTSRLNTEPRLVDLNDQYVALLTHGQQSLNQDTLALAILAPADEVDSLFHTGNINYYNQGYRTVPAKSFSLPVNETICLRQKIVADKPSSHFVYAFWGLADQRWNKLDQVQDYLKKEAQLLSHPILVAIK